MQGCFKTLLVPLFLVFCFLFCFVSCEKAVEIQQYSSPFDYVGLTVSDTIIDTLNSGGLTTYRQNGYRIIVNDLSSMSITESEPVIYNIYRIYENSTDKSLLVNPVARLFRGGRGFASINSSRIVYREQSGKLDTLYYKGDLDTTIVTGAQNKNGFYFAVAAVSQLSLVDSINHIYAGGYLHPVYVSPILHGGSLRQFISLYSLDGDSLTTMERKVELRARLNVSGLDTLYLLKVSLYNDRIQFANFWRMYQQLITNPRISELYRIDNRYLLRLSDSSILNNGRVEVGKFGGVKKVAVGGGQLFSYFNVKYDSIPADSAYGENGWISGVAHDTLPAGQGTKTVYLYNPLWLEPFYSEIGIRPYRWEITLDQSLGSGVKNTDVGYIVTTDDIPFNISTFGDTTFESDVDVWILTRNLSDRVFSLADKDNGVFGFSNTTLMPNDLQGVNSIGYGWPDALKETVPQRYKLLRGIGSRGVVLRTDYETGYRVSPFWYYGVKMNGGVIGASSAVYQASTNGATMNNGEVTLLNIQIGLEQNFRVQPGSFLGYTTRYLDNLFVQDSAVVRGSGSSWLQKVPYVGWFTAEPIASLSPSGRFDPHTIVSQYSATHNTDSSSFAIAENVSDGLQLQTGGRHYMARYAQYFCHPEQLDDAKAESNKPFSSRAQAVLYTVPLRSLPYNSNNSGYKEFALCVYGRGKHFKEPRVLISSFQGNKGFFWDKIPPKIIWPESYNPQIKPYAPVFVMSGQSGKIISSRLEENAIPFVFDVSLLKVQDAVSPIVSVKLKFNFASDLISVDPVSGFRSYRSPDVVVDINRSYLGGRANLINEALFENIDARAWKAGIWDMWFETEDELGNRGIASLIGKHSNDGISGSVRTIKVNQ